MRKRMVALRKSQRNILGRGVTGAKTWRQEKARHVPGSDRCPLWLNPCNPGKRRACAANSTHTRVPQITSQQVSMVLCIVKLSLSICSFSCISRHFQPKNIFSCCSCCSLGLHLPFNIRFSKNNRVFTNPHFLTALSLTFCNHVSACTIIFRALSKIINDFSVSNPVTSPPPLSLLTFCHILDKPPF